MKTIKFFFSLLALASFTMNGQSIHQTYPVNAEDNDLFFNLSNDQMAVIITPFSPDSHEIIRVSNVCHVVSVWIKPTENSPIMIIPPLYNSPPISGVVSGPVDTTLGGGGGTTVKSRPIGISTGGRLTQSGVFISPNPVQEELHIYGIKDKMKNFTIYDFYGQDRSSFGHLNKESQSIRVSDLPKGNYILKIDTTDNQIVTIQFIKS